MAITGREFRKMALAFPEAVESSHMDHPDFRIAGKIFATLGYPKRGFAMVKLPQLAQEKLMSAEPEVFSPVKGAWGRGGATLVRLSRARKSSVLQALAAAWRNSDPKRFLRNRI